MLNESKYGILIDMKKKFEFDELEKSLAEGLIKMRFIYTDGSNHDFIELCHGLDSFLNELVGGEENRAEYIPYNPLDDIHDVIVAYDDDIPVGSASFKKYDDESAEVKRVFIKQAYRGKGISNKLMELLENVARDGQYKDMPDSICMKKKL